MPKHKKTRKEKILADHRRQTHQVASSTPSKTETPPVTSDLLTTQHTKETAHFISPKQTTMTHHAISTIDYRYLRGDLLKTGILTGSIVVIELLLKSVFHI